MLLSRKKSIGVLHGCSYIAYQGSGSSLGESPLNFVKNWRAAVKPGNGEDGEEERGLKDKDRGGSLMMSIVQTATTSLWDASSLGYLELPDTRVGLNKCAACSIWYSLYQRWLDENGASEVVTGKMNQFLHNLVYY